MADFQLVDPRGWEWDLQSVYSAYINFFQANNISWYEKTWSNVFTSFDDFMASGWPVITITDASTGQAHVVTNTQAIGTFLKMMKTRYGEDLPMVDGMLRVTPFETQNRHLRTITDTPSYKRVHNTLVATVLAAKKNRIRSGDIALIQDLWDRKDKTFLAMDFERSERNPNSCLEWGFAALPCGHLEALGTWPPVPAQHYRKGHYVVAEYANSQHNRKVPNHPWEYAFGDTRIVPKAKLAQIIQATITSLTGPESETHANQLVLVTHDKENAVDYLGEMKIKLPNNTLIIDTATLERQIFVSRGMRTAATATGSSSSNINGIITGTADFQGNSHLPRKTGSSVSLKNALRAFWQADLGFVWNCAGNDALANLLLLQLLLQPKGTTEMPRPQLQPQQLQQLSLQVQAGLPRRSPGGAKSGFQSVPGSPVVVNHGHGLNYLTPSTFGVGGDAVNAGSGSRIPTSGRVHRPSSIMYATATEVNTVKALGHLHHVLPASAHNSPEKGNTGIARRVSSFGSLRVMTAGIKKD